MPRPKLRVEPGKLAEVTELAAKGASLPRIAKHLGLSTGTLRRRMGDTPALAEAIAQGRAHEEEALVAELRATGNAGALQFLLKSRHGYRDADAAGPAVQVTNNTLQLQFPKAVKPEDLPKLAQALAPGQQLEAPSQALPAPKPANKGRDPITIDGHALFTGGKPK